jgi:hypothetical protein
MSNPQVKWRLSAYDPDQPRHALKGRVYEDNALFSREYESLSSLYRAAAQVRHRFPSAQLEVQPWIRKGLYWSGDTKDRETLYWCPCGGRLEWPDPDMAHCLRCGNEWARETVEPESRLQ